MTDDVSRAIEWAKGGGLPQPCVVESPYRGGDGPDGYQDLQRTIEYADLCMLDALNHGFAPYLSHLLYTRVLRDSDPGARRLGIDAGTAIALRLGHMRVYRDLGVTDGMTRRADVFRRLGLSVEVVTLGVTTFEAAGLKRPDCISMLR